MPSCTRATRPVLLVTRRAVERETGRPVAGYQRTLDEHQQRGRDVLRELEQKGLAAGEVETEPVQRPPAAALVRARACR